MKFLSNEQPEMTNNINFIYKPQDVHDKQYERCNKMAVGGNSQI